MSSVTDDQVARAARKLGVTSLAQLFDGGQKRVYRADLAGEDVVLKVVATSPADPFVIRRAKREVELLATLSSPTLVKMKSELIQKKSMGESAAWLEEYVPGADLAEMLTAPWTQSETIDLMTDMSVGLALAHRARVTHRDLSPRNVRKREGDGWVVLDFGFARHTLRSGITVAGHPGTLGFLSPEHISPHSSGPTPASDVFGIGILAYLVLAGVLPIRGNENEDYLANLLRCQIVPLRTLRPDLDREFTGIVDKCLNPQSARRFLNADKLTIALRGL